MLTLRHCAGCHRAKWALSCCPVDDNKFRPFRRRAKLHRKGVKLLILAKLLFFSGRPTSQICRRRLSLSIMVATPSYLFPAQKTGAVLGRKQSVLAFPASCALCRLLSMTLPDTTPVAVQSRTSHMVSSSDNVFSDLQLLVVLHPFPQSRGQPPLSSRYGQTHRYPQAQSGGKMLPLWFRAFAPPVPVSANSFRNEVVQ